MISALILSAALAAQSVPRVLFDTRGADGRTYRVSGWQDAATGRLWYWPTENPHVPQVAPDRPELPGMTTDLDGSLNSGVKLSPADATGTLDTNDPGLLSRLAEDCPNGGGGCRKPTPSPDPESFSREHMILLAALVGAALILLPKRQDG